MNATLSATTSTMNPAAGLSAGSSAGSAWSALCASCLAIIERATGARAQGDTVFLRRIDRGGTHWISRPQGRRIVCDSGVLWLCFDGEDADILLKPGQAHTCAQRTRLSVYALEAGSFHLV